LWGFSVLDQNMLYSGKYRIGLLFSTTGPYGIVAQSMLNGTVLALEEFRSDVVTLEPVIADPGGSLERYTTLCGRLLREGIRHIIGCYTSSSRKEIIPLIEKHDSVLWYPSHYEGFETSANVIYTGAAPNQHIIPLIDYMVPRYGNRVVSVGSNYIWAWENNRIMRETILTRGGSVAFERHVPIGETDFTSLIEDILAQRPCFVFNTLIGDSAYAFLRQFRTASAARGIDQAISYPVASCTLSEPELEAIGGNAVSGHISSSVYFSSVGTPENAAFLAAYQRRFPQGPAASADAEASYIAARFLCGALERAGSDDVKAVRAAVVNQRLRAPQGEVWVDPETLHTYLTPRIGVSNATARFDIVREAAQPMAPDPYLLKSSPRFALEQPANRLRIVK
jgi:ABC-type branched-subunit amino acid transport system substrate-binding protein